MTLDKTTLSLTKGEKETLIATIDPDDVENRSVTWASSDATVVTVSKTGEVTAKKVGMATVTATSVIDNSKTATCNVTVVEPNYIVTNGIKVAILA